MSLSGADSVVPRPRQSLPDLGCRRNQVVGTTRASTKSDYLGGEHNAGSTMDRGKHSKVSESKTPTAESIHAIDYSRRFELFETACKVFAIPMEVRHVWSRLRFFPWFRAALTSWLYVVTKDHMRKHQKEYRQFQAEIGPDAFKRPLLIHRNAITTGWKRVGRVSRDNTRARESILEEHLAKNVRLSLHNSFCLNRESKVKSLPYRAKRLQEQREWMRSYEQLKAWEEIVISSDDEEALLKQITVSNI